MSLAERDRKVLWHPYTQMETAPAPLEIVRGSGVWLYTADGRRILDGVSSWWTNIHGHSHPKLNQALAKQAGELEHVIFAGCTHAPAVELAEDLLRVLPKGLARVFYSDKRINQAGRNENGDAVLAQSRRSAREICRT